MKPEAPDRVTVRLKWLALPSLAADTVAVIELPVVPSYFATRVRMLVGPEAVIVVVALTALAGSARMTPSRPHALRMAAR